MKLTLGLSALLLGSALIAAPALADPDSQPNDHHSTGNPHDSGPSGDHDNGGSRHWSGPQGKGPQDFRPHNGTFLAPHIQGNAQFQGNARVHWSKGFDFHDRNVNHFSGQDRQIWTSGHWMHGNHHHRNGWWWNSGGAWFFYDQPTYPYPGYVSDYYDDDYDYGGGPDYNAPSDGGYYWYYCRDPQGYYPYVQQCRGPWQPVEPTPNPQQGYDDHGPGGPGPDANDDDDQGPPDQDQGPGYDDRNGPQGDEDRNGPPPDDRNGPPPDDDNGPPPR